MSNITRENIKTYISNIKAIRISAPPKLALADFGLVLIHAKYKIIPTNGTKKPRIPQAKYKSLSTGLSYILLLLLTPHFIHTTASSCISFPQAIQNIINNPNH